MSRAKSDGPVSKMATNKDSSTNSDQSQLRLVYETKARLGRRLYNAAKDRDSKQYNHFLDSADFPLELVSGVSDLSPGQIVTPQMIDTAEESTMGIGLEAVAQISEAQMGDQVVDDADNLRHLLTLLKETDSLRKILIKNGRQDLIVSQMKKLYARRGRPEANDEVMLQWAEKLFSFSIKRVGTAENALREIQNTFKRK